MPFAWEHPHCAELPPKLREMLDHAQNFSEVMHGAPLLYNLILAEQAHRKESVAKYRREFRRVGEIAVCALPRAGAMEQGAFLGTGPLCQSADYSTHSRIHQYAGGISPWQAMQRGLCDSSDRALADSRAVSGELKKNLARIDNPRAQELWTGDSGTAQLEFRWFISQRLLGDIFDGLEAPDA